MVCTRGADASRTGLRRTSSDISAADGLWTTSCATGPRKAISTTGPNSSNRSCDGPASIQVTEEPNNPHAETGGDGSSPEVLRALAEGVLAARDEVGRRGLPVEVGFNACPAFDPEQVFWRELARIGGAELAGAVDYVGFDFFPDV